MQKRLTLLIVAALLATAGAIHADVIFQDDFAGTTIDAGKWEIFDARYCSETVSTVSQDYQLIIDINPSNDNCGMLGVVSVDRFDGYTDNIAYEVAFSTTSLHNWQDSPLDFVTPLGKISFNNAGTGGIKWAVQYDNASGSRQTIRPTTFGDIYDHQYLLKMEVADGVLNFLVNEDQSGYTIIHTVPAGGFGIPFNSNQGNYPPQSEIGGRVMLLQADRGPSYYDDLVVYATAESEGVCDEFDGSSIDGSMWTIATGTWWQSDGKLHGTWPIGNANRDDGNIQFADAHQPDGDFTFTVDLLAGDGTNYRNPGITLRQSQGNMYWIKMGFDEPYVLVGAVVNSNKIGMKTINYPSFINLGEGAVNTLRLERSGDVYTAYLNDHPVHTWEDTYFDYDTKLGLFAYGEAIYDRACLEEGEPPVLPVALDVKPGSCPNPLNVRSKGNGHGTKIVVTPENEEVNHANPDAFLYCVRGPVLPVAILGTDEFDVMDIDPYTVTLEGIPAMRWNYEDVATPVGDDAMDCECNEFAWDGFIDMTLKFDRDVLIETLGEVHDGEEIALTISGYLYDGSAFEGTDCVTIHGDHVPSPDDGNAPKIESSLPTSFALEQNYPNPFNPITEISFSLPEASEAKLEIFNIMGQRVTTLVDESLPAGHHSATWDATDNASGIYFYRLTAGDAGTTRKMVLLK